MSGGKSRFRELRKLAGERCNSAPRLGIASLCCLALLLSACASTVSFESFIGEVMAEAVVGALELTGEALGTAAAAVIPDADKEKRLLEKRERECLERGHTPVSRFLKGRKYLDCVAADEAGE